MLKIKNAVLATSAVKPDQYPTDELPQIVFLGRSNAGKSSLINTLINRKSLARTSSAPGKTRLLNFYGIDAAIVGEDALSTTVEVPFYFVDLPGYGYAKVSKADRASWLNMIDRFLTTAKERKLLYQLVDIRHAPSAEDKEMSAILHDAGYNIRTIAAKADKISKSQKDKSLSVLSKDLFLPKDNFVVFSAITREGKEQVLSQVEDFLKDFYHG